MEKHRKENQIKEKSYAFALRIVRFARELPRENAGFVLGKQLVGSGTSVIANIEEAQGAFSRDDFIYKMRTAFKEALESNLWLRLIWDSGLLQNKECTDLIRESTEIKNILGRIMKTLENKS
jgi:four helix bundle protein